MAQPDPSITRYNLGLYNSGTYTPAIHDLTNVTQSEQALVTTAENHNYVINQQVQFFIPPQWGMRQLDQLKGFVLSIPTSNSFNVNINSTQFDAFVTPTTPAYVVINPAQVSGIGDMNYGNLAPGGRLPVPNVPPGSYENQRP